MASSAFHALCPFLVVFRFFFAFFLKICSILIFLCYNGVNIAHGCVPTDKFRWGKHQP
jgi:hypothetical protein